MAQRLSWMNRSCGLGIRHTVAAIASVALLGAAPSTVSGGPINVREFPNPEVGAVGDGEHNDLPAIRAAMIAGMREGREVYIPAGTYRIAGSMRLSLEDDLTIRGEGEATVLRFASPEHELRRHAAGEVPRIEGYEMAFSGTSLVFNDTLREDALRNSDTISVEPTSRLADVRPGDIVSLVSDKIAELDWRTPAQHLTSVAAVDVDAGRITLEHPLNFDFLLEHNSRVNVSRPQGRLTIEGLTIAVEESARTVRRQEPVRLSGMVGARVRHVRVLGADALRVGIAVSHCMDSTFEDLYFDVPRYAVTLGNSRDIRFKDIQSYNTHGQRATITPGGWCDGIYVDGLTGDTAAMDAHPSFNVHYRNVVSESERLGNLRSVGGSIRDSRFVATTNAGGSRFQSLRLRNPAIYDDYKFIVENVRVRGPSPIRVQNVGKAVFRNVECVDLDGEPAGVISTASVGTLILENTLPGPEIATEDVRLID